jgi:hypothetical protein
MWARGNHGRDASFSRSRSGVCKFHGKAADIWAMGIAFYFSVYRVLSPTQTFSH